jgi:hypothetical protein
MGTESKTFSIELDCPPGGTRPSHLITHVITDTGLPDRDPVSKCFGNWTWDYRDVLGIEDLWPKIEETLRARITDLYERGVIRYGSW